VSAGCLIWYAIFATTCIRRLGSAYSFANIYIICLGLFHLGLIVPVGLGIFNIPPITQDPWYERAGWYTALTLGCFGAGFALSLRSTSRRATSALPDIGARRTLDAMRSYGIGLLVAAAVSVVLIISQLGNVFQYARLDLFSGAGDVRGFSLFTFTFPSAAILLLIGARSSTQYAFAALLCAVGFVVFMVTGYRTFALFPLLAGAVIWRRTGRKIPAGLAVVGAVFVMVAIPAILELRTSTARFSSISAQSVGSAFGKANAADTFKELGSSVGVLAKALELVPAADPYRYGMSYVQAAAEMVPNLSTKNRRWDRDVILSKSGADRDDALRSSELSTWITYHILGDISFSLGYGAGFTAIGEPYVNFGMLGVVVYFGVLGFMLGRLDQKPLLEHPGWLLFACVAFWHFTNTVRNDMPNFTKPLAFIYVCLFIWRAAQSVLRPPARSSATGT
jgi:oligosaccharide repeat unit polymerase